MINLCLIQESVYVFSVEDWAVLRKTFRMTGELVGNINSVPVLPLKLTDEEVTLLIEIKVARLVKKSYQKESLEFETALLSEQKILYKNNRKKQLETLFDTILAAKRKKGDNRPDLEIFNEELEKSSAINEDNLIWPLMLFESGDKFSDFEDYDVNTRRTLQYLTFKDLWERGYYVTKGHKFGGDFLIYLGDPIVYHAIFIVKCIDDPSKSINSSEVVAFGRLGTSVKKKAVLASLVSNKISYLTINWIDA